MEPSLIDRAAGRVRRYGRQVERVLDDYLVALSNQPQPGKLQQAEQRAVEFARQALRLGMAEGQGDAQVWSGLLKGGGQTQPQTLVVAYLGDGYAKKVNSPQYLRHLLFEPEHLKICERGQFPRTRPRPMAECLAREADLVIFEGNALLGWAPPSGAWVWTPPWLRMLRCISPGAPWEALEQGMRGQKNNIKQMLKHGFTPRISHDAADFELFYEHMHVPMMHKRHAGYGYVDSKEGLYNQFRRGHLLLIQDAGGQPVAGGLFFVQGGEMFAMANGVLNAAPYLYDQGVMSAIYYFMLRWAHENQITRLDAGGVRPFIEDGLHQFKRRWGFQPEPDLWNERRWLFWAPGPSQAALGWLRDHPVAEVEGSRICL